MSALEEALTQARRAVVAAQEALRLAERAAGVASNGTAETGLGEVTVRRINVVEEDGTLRMVIGNSTHARMAPMRGRLVKHPGREATAGILFVNDEGTECGGLQFGGRTRGDQVEQGGYIAFDDFEQNEGFRFGMSQDNGVSTRFLEFSDQPAWSLVDLVNELEHLPEDEHAGVYQRYFGEVDGRGRSRMRLATEADGSAQLVLRDGHGRDRLRLVVPAEGHPRIELVSLDGQARSLIP